jgi:hypothetical protein
VSNRTVNLSVSIDIGSEPIKGSVSNGNRDPQAFSGWIELVAAIEAARSEQHGSRGQTKSLGALPGANSWKL